MSLAFVFPGQGSQSIGMMSALAKVSPSIEATFAEASCGAGLRSLAAMPGRARRSAQSTECTQPAMLTAGVATYRLWRERGGAVARHDGRPQPWRIQRTGRGRYLGLQNRGGLGEISRRIDAAAVPPGQGAMAAILGLEDIDSRQPATRRRRVRWWRRSTSTRRGRW